MRKLASIQKVINVRPIVGADMIEVVDVLGWSVVVKKNEFKVGDLAVYFEVDAFLNANDPRYATFEERFINWNGKRGMRLKTIRLRKQISQGLVLSINQFTEIQNPSEGMDVTELLNIEKWESASETQGNMGGKAPGSRQFPHFIRKTDQERVQNCINELDKHQDDTFEVSIKLDGSSMTVYRVGNDSPHFASILKDIEVRKLKKKGFWGKLWHKIQKNMGMIDIPDIITGVCSRNIELDKNGDNHFSKYVRDHYILDALDNFNRNIAIQGELIAPHIQENHEKVQSPEYYVYDIFDIDNQKYLTPIESREIIQTLGMNYVPVLDPNMKLSNFNATDSRTLVDAILAYAEGPGKNPGVKREGVVFKSDNSEFSFKAVSNSYLLGKK